MRIFSRKKRNVLDVLAVSACSETGYVRRENEDRMSGLHTDWGRIYIVADGVGGHAGGARAAELTVQHLQDELKGRDFSQIQPEAAIRLAFEKANQVVYREAREKTCIGPGMASTAVLVLLFQGKAYVAHVGDSRAYLHREGQLRCLTKDHTRAQLMVEANMMRPDEARSSPDASVLYRAMGQHERIEVDIGPPLPLLEGDGILLCSDGLCGYVEDREIEAVLGLGLPARDVAPRLVGLALAKGGEDNVTVQYLRCGVAVAPRLKTLPPAAGTPPPRRWPTLRQILAFGLGAGFSAAGFAVFLCTQGPPPPAQNTDVANGQDMLSPGDLRAESETMKREIAVLSETTKAQDEKLGELAAAMERLRNESENLKMGLAKLKKKLGIRR